MTTPHWIIAGLGNPGAQYRETRHNVGFMVLDRLAGLLAIPLRAERKFKAEIAVVPWREHRLVLVKPLTYMNLSGESLQAVARFHKVEPDNMLVVYDDIALPFGKIRVRPGGTAGGHNGIKSILRHFNNQGNFPRIRLGIGSPADRDTPESLPDFVLARFEENERKRLPAILEIATEAVQDVIVNGVEQAMNKYNGLTIN